MGVADFIFQQNMAPIAGLMTMGFLCLIGQQTRLISTPIENEYTTGIVKWQMRDMRPNNAVDLKAAIEGPFPSIRLSGATG